MGSFGGVLKELSATQLGSLAIREAIQRISLPLTEINDVLMGSVLQANLGQAPARQLLNMPELPDNVNSATINKVCASGMKVHRDRNAEYFTRRFRSGHCVVWRV